MSVPSTRTSSPVGLIVAAVVSVLAAALLVGGQIAWRGPAVAPAVVCGVVIGLTHAFTGLAFVWATTGSAEALRFFVMGVGIRFVTFFVLVGLVGLALSPTDVLVAAVTIALPLLFVEAAFFSARLSGEASKSPRSEAPDAVTAVPEAVVPKAQGRGSR